MKKHLEPYADFPSRLRPPLGEIAMTVARAWAERATCPRKQVGCVILSSEGFTLATGYNGAPRGAKHCLEVGCEEDSYGHCARSIHAEINAISQAALRGTTLRNSVAYVTLQPCLSCVKAMIQAGIREIRWGQNYIDNSPELGILLNLLDECGIKGGVYNGA